MYVKKTEKTRMIQNNILHHATPIMMKLAPKITQFLSADSHLEEITSFSHPTNLFQFTANLIIYYTNNEGSGISSIRRRSPFTEVITNYVLFDTIFKVCFCCVVA